MIIIFFLIFIFYITHESFSNKCSNIGYSQCGGNFFTGQKCCPSGWVCTYKKDIFSQCTPKESSEKCKNGPYKKCGGINFKGDTCCQDGWMCLYKNDYYSRCVPKNYPSPSPTPSYPPMPSTSPSPTPSYPPMPTPSPSPTPSYPPMPTPSPSPTPSYPPMPSPSPSPTPSSKNFNWINSLFNPQLLLFPNFEPVLTQLQFNNSTSGEYSFFPSNSKKKKTSFPNNIINLNNLPDYYTITVNTKNCKNLHGSGCRSRTELQAGNNSNLLKPEIVKKHKFTGVFKITNFTFNTKMENWENSIVIFQIFGGLGAFCELYWSTGKKPGNLQEPLLILKWGSEDYNILFSKDLALGKIFTIRTYFENEVFYINVIT